MGQRLAFVVCVDADTDHPDNAAIAEAALRYLIAGHLGGMNREPLPLAPATRFSPGEVPPRLTVSGVYQTRREE